MDDPGLPGANWTGKFYCGRQETETTAGFIGETCATGKGSVREATSLAELRSILPELIAVLEGGTPSAAPPSEPMCLAPYDAIPGESAEWDVD